MLCIKLCIWIFSLVIKQKECTPTWNTLCLFTSHSFPCTFSQTQSQGVFTFSQQPWTHSHILKKTDVHLPAFYIWPTEFLTTVSSSVQLRFRSRDFYKTSTLLEVCIWVYPININDLDLFSTTIIHILLCALLYP